MLRVEMLNLDDLTLELLAEAGNAHAVPESEGCEPWTYSDSCL